MQVHFLRPLDEQQQQFLESNLEVDVAISSGDIQSSHKNVKILVAGRPFRE